MSYKLTMTITKREDDPWFLQLSVITSLDQTYDSRDRIIYMDKEYDLFRLYVKKLKENIKDYVGWTREYVGENTLKINHFFDSEDSAKLYHQRATMDPPLNEMRLYRNLYAKKVKESNVKISYSYVWTLTDENGKELAL